MKDNNWEDHKDSIKSYFIFSCDAFWSMYFLYCGKVF